MKYIDADKLIAEIDRQKIGYNTDGEHAAEYNTCRKILDIITSLLQEQQEVDLEEITKFSRIKELPDGFDKDWLKYYHMDKEYNSVKFHHLSALEREYIIARHFSELGKKNMREQMLKDAVEGEVGKDGVLELSNGEAIDVCPSLDKCALGLQLGEKVRIVVLKEEE